jgi:hypothetical protein
MKNLTQLALAAAFIFSLGVVTPAVAQKGGGGGGATDNFGAIAYNEEDGSYGYAYDYDTQGEANKAAIGECGKGCKVVLRLKNECGAIAQSSSHYGWANGSNRKTAEAGALEQCGKGCKVVAWTCTSRK